MYSPVKRMDKCFISLFHIYNLHRLCGPAVNRWLWPHCTFDWAESPWFPPGWSPSQPSPLKTQQKQISTLSLQDMLAARANSVFSAPMRAGSLKSSTGSMWGFRSSPSYPAFIHLSFMTCCKKRKQMKQELQLPPHESLCLCFWSLLTSNVQRLVGLSTRNRRRIPSQSVDM